MLESENSGRVAERHSGVTPPTLCGATPFPESRIYFENRCFDFFVSSISVLFLHGVEAIGLVAESQ